MDKEKSTILILFGITGDLATRKILGVLGKIIKENDLFKDLVILGITRRQEVNLDKLLLNVEDKDTLRNHLEIFQMDLDNSTEYDRLSEKLKIIEGKFDSLSERLFYLAVPPKVTKSIVEMLGNSPLSKETNSKVLLEKPLGTDLKSANDLIEQINKYFNEEQVYIIDHYLAKAISQNFISFREDNPILKDSWSNNFIERIEIRAYESIGIEGRVSFYEKTGALLDLIQSHLLQLVAVTLMDINDKSLHTRKLEILKSLSLPTDEPITHYVHRGQYRKYKEEVNNSDSNIETYVSVTLQSNDPRWIGVPIVLTTGKMLDRKANEIRIFYKNNSKEGGELIFGIQPSIGITIPAWAENSEFKISNYVKDNLPTAYEQVFIYAHKSDHNLFVSSEEVIESWRIITPIQESWAKSNDDLFIYEGGISSESIENK